MTDVNAAIFELVLPCYNEGRSILRLVKRASEAARAAGFTPDEFRLLLVDNGSRDDTASVMNSLSETELGPWFRKVVVEENRGYGFGIAAGLRASGAPWVGWSHADEQCDPKDAFVALKLLRDRGAKNALAKGVRSGRGRKEVFVSRVFEFSARVLLGLSIYEINAQPKVFPRELLDRMKNPPATFAFDLYALYQAKKAGWSIVTTPVIFSPRTHGLSRWASTLVGRYKTILGIIAYMWRLRRREGRL